ncbi:uncharacterized protein NFIA_072210 [Aspergillus fischeri NRRL 181]|uniref:Uncharacterized protein n=1 Tax=Neosartorya fischeri (strain ATCC 1020 / DSM 3700 / CBS 544.65 / FGSC A1164 / JCM 1740 / NRRL 181 / WB 181) TaxID=331117 RepID=A1DD50_NEOFI|nr:uncharacterized protein NFIA_072210 [Aspergillus fischeri NRRL 181]EAW17307.1 hypothetical protein NFIA_072210 [Aspergillus fischeri NRRL 181]
MVEPDNFREIVDQIDRYPIMGKLVRRRGSHDAAQLQHHAKVLLAESPLIMLEEFLAVEEATITVMPLTPSRPDYWRVARLIGATAPIRVDVRRFRLGSDFALFDITMQPNMTGPGLPGREDQASLTALAAAAMGWDYDTLLQHILEGAQPLSRFHNYRSPF